MPVARHPPHRSVRALLTHTVLTLDVWTQSAPPDTDAGSRLPGSGARVSPEIAPMSSGSVDSAGEAATTTCVALRAETPSVGPRCAGPHGTGNIREPPTGATPQCPWSSRAGARAVSAESASTWLPFACRTSSGTPGSIPSDDSSHRYRSEEHTSELQSLRHLVCRLLLEKKKY